MLKLGRKTVRDAVFELKVRFFRTHKVAIEDCCGPLLEKLLFFKMICFLNIFSGYRIKSLNGIQTFFFKYYYYHIYVEI